MIPLICNLGQESKANSALRKTKNIKTLWKAGELGYSLSLAAGGLAAKAA